MAFCAARWYRRGPTLRSRLCSLAMASEATAMLVRQRDEGTPAEVGARLLAETGRELGGFLIVGGHQRAVERRGPERGKEEAVVHVEPLGVAFAVRPWDDVRGAEQGRVRDPG